jgi:hypothetical protein
MPPRADGGFYRDPGRGRHLRFLLQRRDVLHERHVGAPDGVAVASRLRLVQPPLQPQHLRATVAGI